MHLGIWSAFEHVRLEVVAANVKANNYAKMSSEVPCEKSDTKVGGSMYWSILPLLPDNHRIASLFLPPPPPLV